ncbi:MAG: NAD(P)/FAD-dependent oxidoreductase [Waterburya sp.]
MSKIVVIGCGIVGAAIAYELSLITGLEITVIEKNAPATGSTGAALGVLMGAISHKKKGRAWRFRSASLQRYQTLIPELEAKTGLPIAVNHQGIFKLLFAGEDLDKWQKLQEFRRLGGWTLEIGDRNFVTSHCPQIVNEQIIGAVYSPQDGQVNPVELTQALVAGARTNGVEFLFGVEVQDFVTQTGLRLGKRNDFADDFAPSRQGAKKKDMATCKYLVTSSGQIEVEELIISAGLGSTALTQSLQQSIPIRPVLGQAIKLQLDQPLGNPDFQPVITGNDIHLVPLGNNQYWLGATVEFPSETGTNIANESLLEELMAGAIAFCPELKSATILETWSGNRPRPEGIAAPIIERLSGYSNVLLATAHYRNGVLLAPATALEVVQILSKRPD